MTEDRALEKRRTLTKEFHLRILFSSNLLDMSQEPLSERGGARSAMQELRPEESFIINGALDPVHLPRL